MAEYISQTMTTNNQYVKYRIVVTLNSQSVSANTSSINVKVQAWRTNNYDTYGSGTCHCYIQGTWFSAAITPSQHIKLNSYTQLFSRDATITHNTDGSCKLDVAAYITHDVLTSGTQSYYPVLPTIPRASVPTLSKTSFSIGEQITIKTNRASSAFTHSIFLRHADGLYYGAIASNVGTEWVWNTSNQANYLYEACPNSSKCAGTLLLRTYQAGKEIGDKYISFEATVVNSDPTLESVDIVQTDEKVLSLVDRNPLDIIQDKSKLHIKFNNAQAKNYAKIKNYCVQIGSNPVIKQTSPEFDIEKISNIKSQETVLCWVEDTRWRDGSANFSSTKISKSLGNYYPYTLPNLHEISAKRKNDIGAEVTLTFQSHVAPIIARNSGYQVKLRHKESAASGWGEDIILIENCSDEDVTFQDVIKDSSAQEVNFDSDRNYNLELCITDTFGSYSYPILLQTSRPELSIRDNMVGINCVPQKGQGVLQVDGKSLYNYIISDVINGIYPVGSIYLSAKDTNPGTLFPGTKWERAAVGKALFGVADGVSGFTAGSSGGATAMREEL